MFFRTLVGVVQARHFPFASLTFCVSRQMSRALPQPFPGTAPEEHGSSASLSPGRHTLPGPRQSSFQRPGFFCRMDFFLETVCHPFLVGFGSFFMSHFFSPPLHTHYISHAMNAKRVLPPELVAHIHLEMHMDLAGRREWKGGNGKGCVIQLHALAHLTLLAQLPV